MAHHVYANGNEIASRSASGKSTAAFPDPCFSPPTPPPTGVPVPYPNTCVASDIRNGSRSVYIKRKEVALEDKSYFKTSSGDEPATQALKKGVASSKLKGKNYFQGWSPNVKIEGTSVDRHMDSVTHNHGSPANTPPWPYMSSQSFDKDPCAQEKMNLDNACDGSEKNPVDAATQAKHTWSSDNQWIADYCGGLMSKPGRSTKSANNLTKHSKKNNCLKRRKCKLVPYEDAESMEGKGCCPGQTGHHAIPHACMKGLPCYENAGGHARAPTICLEGVRNTGGSHGLAHHSLKAELSDNGVKRGTAISYTDMKNNALKAIKTTIGKGCSENCLGAQLDEFYKNCMNGNVWAHNGMGGPWKKQALQSSSISNLSRIIKLGNSNR